jgi:dolichol-phosphate mannosyltransferase
MIPSEPLPEFSVVVPFHNEGGVAFAVVEELCHSLDELKMSWEVVLVDDGSTDATAVELGRSAAREPRCRVLSMPANLGQGPALFAGIQAARARIIGMMDGDGQNVPSDFAILLRLLERSDLVVGVRAARHDSWVRRIASRTANAVRRRFLNDRVRDAGCALKVFRREVVSAFSPIPMLNPFMPALAVSRGFRVNETIVRHRARTAGRSHYGLHRIMIRPALEMLAVKRLIRRTPVRAAR